MKNKPTVSCWRAISRNLFWLSLNLLILPAQVQASAVYEQQASGESFLDLALFSPVWFFTLVALGALLPRSVVNRAVAPATVVLVMGLVAVSIYLSRGVVEVVNIGPFPGGGGSQIIEGGGYTYFSFIYDLLLVILVPVLSVMVARTASKFWALSARARKWQQVTKNTTWRSRFLLVLLSGLLAFGSSALIFEMVDYLRVIVSSIGVEYLEVILFLILISVWAALAVLMFFIPLGWIWYRWILQSSKGEITASDTVLVGSVWKNTLFLVSVFLLYYISLFILWGFNQYLLYRF